MVRVPGVTAVIDLAGNQHRISFIAGTLTNALADVK
jgi:hypothetical protein